MQPSPQTELRSWRTQPGRQSKTKQHRSSSITLITERLLYLLLLPLSHLQHHTPRWDRPCTIGLWRFNKHGPHHLGALRAAVVCPQDPPLQATRCGDLSCYYHPNQSNSVFVNYFKQCTCLFHFPLNTSMSCCYLIVVDMLVSCCSLPPSLNSSSPIEATHEPLNIFINNN